MTRIIALLTRSLLAICLALFGMSGAVGANVAAGNDPAGPVFAVEICADGGVRMLLVDAAGNPVDSEGSAAACVDCDLCCHTPVVGAGPDRTALPVPALRAIALDPSAPPAPVILDRQIRKMPRGPPAIPVLLPNLPGPIAAAASAAAAAATDRDRARDGRTFRKDATA